MEKAAPRETALHGRPPRTPEGRVARRPIPQCGQANCFPCHMQVGSSLPCLPIGQLGAWARGTRASPRRAKMHQRVGGTKSVMGNNGEAQRGEFKHSKLSESSSQGKMKMEISNALRRNESQENASVVAPTYSKSIPCITERRLAVATGGGGSRGGGQRHRIAAPVQTGPGWKRSFGNMGSGMRTSSEATGEHLTTWVPVQPLCCSLKPTLVRISSTQRKRGEKNKGEPRG